MKLTKILTAWIGTLLIIAQPLLKIRCALE